MIKYIVSDLDGTLLNSDYAWDDKIQNALERILLRDVEFVVATGRTMAGLVDIKWLWNAPIYLILMNGSLILDKERNVFYSSVISQDIIQVILNQTIIETIEYITKDKILTTLSKEEYISKYSKWDLWKNKVLNKKSTGFYDDYLSKFIFNASHNEIEKAQILKINGLFLNEEERNESMMIVEGLQDRVVNAPFDKNVFELTMKNVSKASALESIILHEDWDKNSVAVFGDGGNDIELIKQYNHSYAPFNAIEEIKKNAKEVVDANDNYGVIKKMLELINLSDDEDGVKSIT